MTDKAEAEKKEQDFNKSQTVSRLDLSYQDLEKLPEYVLTKINLEELDISNNNISGALPAKIRHLQNLRVLNASNNKMTGVPAEVGQLKKLEILDLSNNRLTGLPYELGNLKNLKTLNLSGNNYARQDLEVIKKSLPDNTEIIL
jgi:Leucine-rich repeat (LRR) protein